MWVVPEKEAFPVVPNGRDLELRSNLRGRALCGVLRLKASDSPAEPPPWSRNGDTE